MDVGKGRDRMEGLIGWVKSLACFTVFISILLQVLPNKKYEKYIRLYMGILMILFLMLPIASLFRLDEKIQDFFARENLKMELGDMAFEMELKEASGAEALKETYEKELLASIGGYLEEKGYYIQGIEASWDENLDSGDFGSLTTLGLVVSKEEKKADSISVEKVVVSVFGNQEENVEEKNLKNELVNFYNLSPDNINVSIQGGER